MLSMTGFGNGEGRQGDVTVTVELRSVNHRFLDVSLRLPSSLAVFEFDIRKFLKDNLARGRVTVAAQVTTNQEAGESGLSAERLDQAIAMLKAAAARLAKETGKPQPISLSDLVRVPDLLRPADPDSELGNLQAALMQALAAAQAQLLAMKTAEGDALVKEMNQRLDTLAKRLAEVSALAPQAAVEIHKKMQERLDRILAGQIDQIDPQRLAQEVALLADRANINEECERLGIHIGAYRAALQEGGQVAKRLNFLLQEMHREVNTMGSKTNLMAITQTVIAMKDEVESLREQVQNLE